WQADQRQRSAPGDGRARRALTSPRMPRRRLPHVHLPQGLGRHARRSHRRALYRIRRRHSALRERTGGSGSARSLREDIMQTKQLSAAETEAFGAELDDLLRRTKADLGERDVRYIRKARRLQLSLEIAGRGLLFASFFPPAWALGTAALSLSKI